MLGYDWEMKERSIERNIPQTIIQEEVVKQKYEWVEVKPITWQMVLNESLNLESTNTLNTLETFEEEYIIKGNVYKIIYKIKSSEKPRVEQLIDL